MTTTLRMRGLYLEYATLGWNVVGVAVLLGAAWPARSVALVGFGLDSLIEIFASVVVIWQLNDTGHERQPRALRLIGIAFVLLAIYILGQTGYSLLAQLHPASSLGGIAWIAATCVVMLLLAWGKKATGEQLNNPVLQTESYVTLIDALLAAAVLVGLALNGLLGWWWADPLAGLVIVYYGLKEGLHTLGQNTTIA